MDGRVRDLGRVGFVGSKWGLSTEQLRAVSRMMSKVLEFHHGDMVGSDKQVADLAMLDGVPIVVSHPPKVNMYRAYAYATVIRPVQDYQVRNKEIIDEIELLVVAPFRKGIRGATWWAVGYADLKQRSSVVIYPNGELEFRHVKK